MATKKTKTVATNNWVSDLFTVIGVGASIFVGAWMTVSATQFIYDVHTTVKQVNHGTFYSVYNKVLSQKELTESIDYLNQRIDKDMEHDNDTWRALSHFLCKSNSQILGYDRKHNLVCGEE